MDKKGVSGVILAVIMIVIVLVAVGIYWGFAGGVIEDSKGSSETQAKCLMTQIEVTKAECADASNPDCSLELEVTGEIPEGIAIVFNDGSSSEEVTEITSGIGLATIATRDVTVLSGDAVTGVTVTPVYGTGEDRVLCSNAVTADVD